MDNDFPNKNNKFSHHVNILKNLGYTTNRK